MEIEKIVIDGRERYRKKSHFISFIKYLFVVLLVVLFCLACIWVSV